MATLTREASVQVSVENGKDFKIFEVLKEVGVEPAVHLTAVQELPNRLWDITFKSVNIMRTFLPQLEQGCGFSTNPYSSSATIVNVLHVPHELQDSAVRFVLGKYGRVLAGRYKTYKDYPNVFNGIRQYRIVLKHDIPSSLQLGGRNCWVRYNGQPRTCVRCGLKDHEVKDCKYLKCYRCQAFGHVTKDCASEIVCSICERPGHMHSDCPISFANKVQPIPGKWQRVEQTVGTKQGEKSLYVEPNSSLVERADREKASENCGNESKEKESGNSSDTSKDKDSGSNGETNKDDCINMDCQEGLEYQEETDSSSETEMPHGAVSMDSQEARNSQSVKEADGGELDQESEHSQLWYTQDSGNLSPQLPVPESPSLFHDNPSEAPMDEVGGSLSFSVGSNTPTHEPREGRSIISGNSRKRSASQPNVHKRKERSRAGNRFPKENPMDYVKMTQIFIEEDPWHSCVVKGCQVNFSKYTDLQKHLTEVHPREDKPQYPCVLHKACAMLFTNPREWLVHIASSHPEFAVKKELEFFDQFYLKR